ncbi:MAG: HEPN domain-containing protein [Anaerolineae bacterium]|nr:HEPN domain-containing protein [Anaerolineae bacterium]MBL8105591.1 HEPN domain-containing protein [Anaerolineales bacterium]MCC7189222.1 HEPN domain-containing protein [Anaerolineales bacterium]
MDAKRTLTRKWVMKARRDLLSAKKLARGKDSYLDTAIYHCQQTAEKVIKGWLVYHDLSFEKTHDLRLLVTMASEVEPKFTSWFDVAEQVSPYATAYRYPGETLEPTEEEYQKAYKAASEFYQFVCSLLPAEVSAP